MTDSDLAAESEWELEATLLELDATQDRIDALRAEVARLTAENKTLRERIANLERVAVIVRAPWRPRLERRGGNGARQQAGRYLFHT